MPNALSDDLDRVLASTRELWEELRGQRIVITGTTGFFPCWLLETLLWANDRLGLNTRATILSRNSQACERKAPHLPGHPAVDMLSGDVRSFHFHDGSFSHVIHAATRSSAALNKEQPEVMFDTIIEGTRRCLEFALAAAARKFLLTSSGAVYGKQPPQITHIQESFSGGPDPLAPNSACGEGKRAVRQPAYRDILRRVIGKLENSDLVTNQLFWIGVYPGITPPMHDYVLDVFHQFTRRENLSHARSG